QIIQDLDESTGNHGGLVTEALEGADGGPGPRSQDDVAGHLVDDGGVQTGEGLDPLSQGLLEVELTAHGTLGDLRDLGLLTGVSCEHLDDLTGDEGGIAVEADQTLGTTQQART